MKFEDYFKFKEKGDRLYVEFLYAKKKVLLKDKIKKKRQKNG